MFQTKSVFLLLLGAFMALGFNIGAKMEKPNLQIPPEMFQKSNHTNNWAVLVVTSQFWFNYRHSANVLSIYRSVKRLGIPDSHIILMLPDDMACNFRNPHPATIFNNANEELNLYGDDVEVDYRGYEVSQENFIRLLTDRMPDNTPRSKRLLTDEGSNILIYLSGHGRDGYIKFQDTDEVSDEELADVFEQMWQKRRYNEILIIIDSCDAASMYRKFYTPNILAVATSLEGEKTLSRHIDPAIGVHIIDPFAHYLLKFLEKEQPKSKRIMSELLTICPNNICEATIGVRKDLLTRDPSEIPITDFFGSFRRVVITSDPIYVLDVLKRKAKIDYLRNNMSASACWSYLPQFPVQLSM